MISNEDMTQQMANRFPCISPMVPYSFFSFTGIQPEKEMPLLQYLGRNKIQMVPSNFTSAKEPLLKDH